MNTIFIAFIVVTIFILLWRDDRKPEAFGNISEVVSVWNKGFSVTGGLRSITREMAYKNALVIGPSGSGKTSTVIFATLNALARGNSSAVVLDVSGEIYTLMSGYLSKKYKIYSIDFSNNSDGFNPLHACKTISDMQKVARILMKNSGTESKSDPYWSASAEKVLSIFIQYLLTYTNQQFHTMANLARMIETFAGEPEKIDRCFATADDALLIAYKAVISVGDKTLQSTISSALVALKVFTNPQVARVSAKSTFDFAQFRKEKSVLFINAPVSDVSFLAPYTALMFEHLFNVILASIPPATDNAIFAILDEMVTMRFENLGLVYSNIRKYNGGVLGIVQDERMLEMAWSTAEAHAIRTNSYAKVYLPGQPHQTCKTLEEIIGKDEYNRPVMSAAQIRQSEQAVILVGNRKPYLEAMIPYYNHWLLAHRTAYLPYTQNQKIPFDSPPILEFKL